MYPETIILMWIFLHRPNRHSNILNFNTEKWTKEILSECVNLEFMEYAASSSLDQADGLLLRPSGHVRIYGNDTIIAKDKEWCKRTVKMHDHHKDCKTSNELQRWRKLRKPDKLLENSPRRILHPVTSTRTKHGKEPVNTGLQQTLKLPNREGEFAGHIGTRSTSLGASSSGICERDIIVLDVGEVTACLKSRTKHGHIPGTCRQRGGRDTREDWVLLCTGQYEKDMRNGTSMSKPVFDSGTSVVLAARFGRPSLTAASSMIVWGGGTSGDYDSRFLCIEKRDAGSLAVCASTAITTWYHVSGEYPLPTADPCQTR
ncbi:hypothetical protein NA56DRAFT_711000 [Hyaloscypha hepaticicola]|uniref:Uncharacterized protein n=1 Tax=Hyaloscypha hepaticicola TaxID=2082293 RepID=A0A2J6PK56_9HELO|nr:hypothetical protein NA56DRAFT_711000 [Hyaloscypha hepaticicola]